MKWSKERRRRFVARAASIPSNSKPSRKAPLMFLIPARINLVRIPNWLLAANRTQKADVIENLDAPFRQVGSDSRFPEVAVQRAENLRLSQHRGLDDRVVVRIPGGSLKTTSSALCARYSSISAAVNRWRAWTRGIGGPVGAR